MKGCWQRVGLGLWAVFAVAGPVRAEEPVRLRERFPVGYLYQVRTRVELSGSLTPEPVKGKPAPKPVTIRGDSAVEYEERVLTVSPGGEVEKTVRVCRRMEVKRTVGGQRQGIALRPGVRRLVILRRGSTEVPFSPDGPLLWGEIDLVRTDVFTPALAGLLPERGVRVGERWTASAAAVQELTDMEKVEGRVECRLEEVYTERGRRTAKVSFGGTVRGTNEDGPSRQKLAGHLLFDLESNHISYLLLKATHSLLDRDKEVGRVEGRFVLMRQPLASSRELGDSALKGVKLEPDADNTLLLYDNPDLGVRFLHPRRWRLAEVRGSQVALATPDGSGLLLTLDPPARVPTGNQFLAESRAFLEKQKVRILRVVPPERLRAGAHLERFALEAQSGAQKFWMDYYVTRQANGGATLAARLLPRDLAALRKEVDRIARSVVVTKKIEEPPKKK
jgi:hypothetical protein